MILSLRGCAIMFPRRPLVMGIVNITDDSFSGDGSLEIDRAIQNAQRHVAAGADIIDVGGESARTNRSEISEREEIERILPCVRTRHLENGEIFFSAPVMRQMRSTS